MYFTVKMVSDDISQTQSQRKNLLSLSDYIGDDDLEFSILTFFGVFDSISNVPIKTLGDLNRHVRKKRDEVLSLLFFGYFLYNFSLERIKLDLYRKKLIKN